MMGYVQSTVSKSCHRGSPDFFSVLNINHPFVIIYLIISGNLFFLPFFH